MNEPNPTAVIALELAVGLHVRISGSIDQNSRNAVTNTAGHFYEWLEGMTTGE